MPFNALRRFFAIPFRQASGISTKRRLSLRRLPLRITQRCTSERSPPAELAYLRARRKGDRSSARGEGQEGERWRGKGMIQKLPDGRRAGAGPDEWRVHMSSCRRSPVTTPRQLTDIQNTATAPVIYHQTNTHTHTRARAHGHVHWFHHRNGTRSADSRHHTRSPTRVHNDPSPTANRPQAANSPTYPRDDTCSLDARYCQPSTFARQRSVGNNSDRPGSLRAGIDRTRHSVDTDHRPDGSCQCIIKKLPSVAAATAAGIITAERLHDLTDGDALREQIIIRDLLIE